MSNLQTIKEAFLSKENITLKKKFSCKEETLEITNGTHTLPEPTVTGDEKIIILSHNLTSIDMRNSMGVSYMSAEIAIRNVSNKTIATAIFEAIFYNKDGDIVDTVEHKEIYIKSNTSRSIHIISTRDPVKIRSYNVKLVKTIAADIEKIQLRSHKITATESGEEVRGIVKNISDIRTNAVLVATFQGKKGENIGAKAILLKNIEPHSIKIFNFTFKPQLGDAVRTYTLNIVCDTEEM